jgi:hypothetical protein
MSERKAIPSDMETGLLTDCALCFGLDGDAASQAFGKNYRPMQDIIRAALVHARQ